MTTELSIIVPIYNVQQYLDEALSSLITSTNEKHQIILIDDGSTDGSLEILTQFTKNRSNIKIIKQINKGYGSACNIGIKSSSGEYIAFFEPDDVLSPQFYATLLQMAKSFKPDIVRYNGFYRFDAESTEIKSNQFKKYCGRVFKIKEVSGFWRSHPSIWNAIYKRQTLLDANVRFPEGKGASFQDTQFMVSLYYSCKTILFIDQVAYYYRQHPDQSVKNADSKVDAVLDNMKHQLDWFRSQKRIDDDYLIYSSFNQFRTLYGQRLRTQAARKKLLRGYRRLKAQYSDNQLSYPDASTQMRQLYKLLPIYPLAIKYFKWRKIILKKLKVFFQRP